MKTLLHLGRVKIIICFCVWITVGLGVLGSTVLGMITDTCNDDTIIEIGEYICNTAAVVFYLAGVSFLGHKIISTKVRASSEMKEKDMQTSNFIELKT